MPTKNAAFRHRTYGLSNLCMSAGILTVSVFSSDRRAFASSLGSLSRSQLRSRSRKRSTSGKSPVRAKKQRRGHQMFSTTAAVSAAELMLRDH